MCGAAADGRACAGVCGGYRVASVICHLQGEGYAEGSGIDCGHPEHHTATHQQQRE